TNRSQKQMDLVRDYCKANMLWRTGDEEIEYSRVVELNLNTLEPTVSGPKRPQDKILVKDLDKAFSLVLDKEFSRDYVPFDNRKEHVWLNEGGSGTQYTQRDTDK